MENKEELNKEEVKRKEEVKNKEVKKEKVKGKKNIKKIIIIVSAIIVALLMLSVLFALLNMGNTKVIKGVTINGIDVSMYNKSELTEKCNDYISKNQSKIIKLKYKEQEFDITPDELQTTYNSEEVVKEAYSYGRDSNIFVNNFKIVKALLFKADFKLVGSIDENILKEKVASISGNMEGVVVQPSYYIEEDELIITKGKAGFKINDELLKKLVVEDINKFEKEMSIIEIPAEETEPDPIDLEKIRSEIYSEPQDAYITEDPLTVHPNINGVDFAISMEEALEIIKEDKEEYIIPLKITIANKTLADLGKEAFPNLLGTFSTKFDVSNSSRSNNIELATKKINGVIVLPGQTFSYNKTVGKRTIDSGFKEAPAYVKGQVVQEVGGGICQVSSTLYNAALYANLEIVERHNHTFESSYVAASRDATVSWGSVDFKFKNNRKYPVRIEASSRNGTETVSIYGLKEEDEYEVIIRSNIISKIERQTEYVDDDTIPEGEEKVYQSGHDGCTSEAYKILRRNGQNEQTILLSKDTYNTLPKIIHRGTKKIQKENKVEESLHNAEQILQNYIPETPPVVENEEVVENETE